MATAPGPYAPRIGTPDRSCSTCEALRPIGPGGPSHGPDGRTGTLELVVHGDAADAHDFHTGRPGSFVELLDAAEEARSAGRPVVATVPLTRSTYRLAAGIPLLLRTRGFSALRFHVPELAEGTKTTLVPRLGLAMPFTLHAAAVARRLELPAYTSGAPLCLLGPHAASRIETPPRAFGAPCERCPARDKCPGVDGRYLEAYGDGELRPVTGEVPPASGERAAGLFGR